MSLLLCPSPDLILFDHHLFLSLLLLLVLKQHLSIVLVFVGVVVHKYRLLIEHETLFIHIHGVHEVITLVIDSFQLLLKVKVFNEYSWIRVGKLTHVWCIVRVALVVSALFA